MERVLLSGVTDAERERVAELLEADRTIRKQRYMCVLSLIRTGKHIYTGTVTAKVKTKRRARGRVAKASRKTNRP